MTTMTTAAISLKQQAPPVEQETISLGEGLVDDPDCLAEFEHVFSVFRFRYEWGTVFELTFTNHADAEDRKACFYLMPPAHVYLETIDTDTMGVGANGITQELTHRFITSAA